jgi:hypothetical protein
MVQLTKSIHVLALGLWFGTAVFFSFVVAFSLFGTFDTIAQQEPRPVWFPLAPLFNQDPTTWTNSTGGSQKPIFETAADVRKEQGTRAAGWAIGPMFDWYFLFQGVCGVLALATALPWSRVEPHVRAHKLRVIVLLVAFATVVGGWPLERAVSALRGPRDETTDALLRAAPAIPESVYQKAVDARQTFGAWHGFSTLLNLSTVALVTVGMALAARLPAATGRKSDVVSA